MKSNDNSIKKVKILVLGKPSVGKSTMIKELMGQPDANLGEQKEFSLNLNVDDINFELLLSENTFENFENEDINDFDGFLLVYGVDDRDSFNQVKKSHQLIVQKKGIKKFGLIIVANKSEISTERKVPKEEGERYCMETNVDFFEVSCIDKNNVKECFLSISQKILKFKYPEIFEKQKQNNSDTSWCFCY